MEANTTTSAALADADFKALIPLNKFVRLEYFTDLHEYIKTDTLVKQFIQVDNIETLELATGERIPIDRVVYISGNLSPHYPGYESYSCDC